MYNRYIRNDRGVYTRIPEDESRGPEQEWTRRAPPPQEPPPRRPFGPTPPPPDGDGPDGISGALRKLLDRFHLENVDTGDLLLLLLLFLLFEEDADDELLLALGLLLIL